MSDHQLHVLDLAVSPAQSLAALFYLDYISILHSVKTPKN